MIVYHGTDTLKFGQIPTPNMPDNGSFFSLTKEYATQFGDKVFSYELDESLVLDLRKQSHKKMVKDKFSKDWSILELNESNGLPWSFNDAKEIESIDKIKEIALSLGFIGAFFDEGKSFGLSIEVYDVSSIKWIGIA